MKYLIEKSKSVESKRKDILQSNQAFVSILQTSINVLATTDPHGDDKVSYFQRTCPKIQFSINMCIILKENTIKVWTVVLDYLKHKLNVLYCSFEIRPF